MERDELERIVQESVEAYNRAFSERKPDTYLSFLDPDVEYVTVTSDAEGLAYRGVEEVRQYLRGLHDAFAENDVVLEEIEHLAPGIVMTRSRWHAVGRHSGVALDAWLFVVSQVNMDGRLVRMRAYLDEDEARNDTLAG